MSRSTDLFRQQWGKTLVANYGFGAAYVLVAVFALGPAALVYFGLGSTFLAVTLGAVLLTPGRATAKSLDIIYKVSLYDYAATGRVGGGFSGSMVQNAYVSKRDRGPFRRDEIERPAAHGRAA